MLIALPDRLVRFMNPRRLRHNTERIRKGVKNSHSHQAGRYIGRRFVGAAGFVFAMAGVGLMVPPAHAYIPAGSENGENFTSIAAAPNGGYWVQVDGENGAPDETRAINGAPSFQSVGQPGTIAAIPGQEGYWVVTRDGVIHSRGTVPTGPELGCQRLSDCSGYPSDPSSNEYVTAAAAHPSGLGL